MAVTHGEAAPKSPRLWLEPSRQNGRDSISRITMRIDATPRSADQERAILAFWDQIRHGFGNDGCRVRDAVLASELPIHICQHKWQHANKEPTVTDEADAMVSFQVG